MVTLNRRWWTGITLCMVLALWGGCSSGAGGAGRGGLAGGDTMDDAGLQQDPDFNDGGPGGAPGDEPIQGDPGNMDDAPVTDGPMMDDPSTDDPPDVPSDEPGAPPEPSAAAVADFAVSDVNPESARFEASVSPRDYLGQVSAWYFGHST